MADLHQCDNVKCLAATTFHGKISAQSFAHDVKFTAHAGEDGRLIIDPVMVPAGVYIALTNSMGEPGVRGHALELSGESASGVTFASSSVRTQSARSGSAGFQIQLAADDAKIVLPRTDCAEGANGVKFSLRGFKSFRPNPVQSKLGQLIVQGATRPKSADDVSGAISVKCSDMQSDENWYREAEALVKFIWQGLQFGHGGRLHIPLKQEFRPNQVIATFRHGSGHPHHLPAIHFLNQSDYISALVARYESEDPFPEAIWLAAAWLNNDSSIDEMRFLALMTAIETILHNLFPGSREWFAIKLEKAIKQYSLTSGDFDRNLIELLKKQRNSIIHQGKALPDSDLWESILHARELVARIIFAELSYTGAYESYAQGYERRVLS